MKDPWQDDALDGLVAYVQAAREAGGTAWAVVVTSSEELAAQVLEALETRVGRLEVVDVCAGEDPRRIVAASLEKPRQEAFRTTVLRGSSDVVPGEHGDEFLTWLNFHREDFEKPAEAFVFMLAAEHADAWSRLAPDLDRYTQHFELIDWADRLADAEQTARVMEVDLPELSVLLRDAEEQLERARSLGSDFLVHALVEVAHGTIEASAFERAGAVVAEARTLTEGAEDAERLSVLVASAALLSDTGHPQQALAELEQANGESEPEYLATSRGIELFYLGQPRQALALHESCLESVTDHRFVACSSNAADVEQWLGCASESMRRVRDLRPTSTLDESRVMGALASLSVDAGDMLEALEPLMKSLRTARALGSDHLRIAALANLARATLDVGHPTHGLQLLDGTASSPGWKSARSYGLAIVRAEACWVLFGPSAVLRVVRDERERQRGWNAPIPAAELAYVRALASVEDDEARRYLQEAAERFRAMDGWYYLSELERHLARLDRLQGDLDRATARIEECLQWHAREGLRPREARDRTELAMIALGRHDPQTAHESASKALELILACGTRLYEPAALVALAAAEQALGHQDVAAAHERRWRRLVTGIDAKGLQAALERDAAWARGVVAS